MSKLLKIDIGKNMNNPKQIVVHHSASDQDTTAEQVNEWHKNRDWSVPVKPSSLGWYAQYHYFIESGGKVTQFRKHDEVGWHAGDWVINSSSIAICFAGNFQDDQLTSDQIQAYDRLIKDLLWEFPQLTENNLRAHREFKATSCPGENIVNSFDLLKKAFIKKDMEYIIVDGEQYLLYEPLKLAFNIGDEEQLDILRQQGLVEEPIMKFDVDGYVQYPLVTKDKLKDLLGL